jgi:hypothetical protein
MTKTELAEQMRQQQRAYHESEGFRLHFPNRAMRRYIRRQVEEMPDQAMIDSYTTCSCCGEKNAPEDVIDACIEKACCLDAFFDLLNAQHPANHD